MKKSIFKIIRIVCKVLFYLLIGFMIFLYFNPSLIRNCIIEKEFIRRLGKILPALIAVAGVYATVANNRKGPYKEIVTRERIEWLHKMQEALAEFLAITSNTKVTNRFEDKKERARELYYLIISNLNVKEDKDKKNDRKAVELLYKYAISKGLDVELNFVKDEDREEKKDSNDTKSIEELRKEIISKYTEIFNETWNRIKDEAD